ncbi:hypothetical protein [Morganella sp. GD04133]|uniref:hypothetical protein n=1 Tax=Morganella sp. GD04133 TaxID=2975435 RepID=UPI002449E3C2|nr:hypothetical protein [Morganella sp. GD04133]MDH0354266.1 hypothetical protein [Morganella sp. GD04133]
MTTSVTATGSMNYDHFVEIAKKSNQDDIVTLSSNGRESRLTAGRSLCERFIIMLNSTRLGSICCINAMYKKLQHREAQAVTSFCKAINDIYEERSQDIVNSHIKGKKKLVVTDVINILDKIKINGINYKKCLEKDKTISLLIKKDGFADFCMSQLNHFDLALLSDLTNRVDELMVNTINRKSFCDDFKSALKTALVDFVTAMPASSYKFMDTVAGKNISGFNTAEEKYEKNEINIYGELDPNFTTEDFEQISEGAAMIKAQLIYTGKHDQYRHNVYADLFYKFNEILPQAHINAAASENIVPPQQPSLPQVHATVPKNMAPPPLPHVHTDATPPPPPPPPPNIDIAASKNKQLPPINPTALPSEQVELRKKTENNKPPEIDFKTAIEAAINRHRIAKAYSMTDDVDDVDDVDGVDGVDGVKFYDCN